MENTLSDGALVAGTAKIPRASNDNFGKVSVCLFHHCGRSSDVMEIERYCFNSRSLDERALVCLASISCLAVFHTGSSSSAGPPVAESSVSVVGPEQYFAIMSDKNCTLLISRSFRYHLGILQQ